MPKTLLLADDSVTIQKVVGITFANEDVELVTVDNGEDALRRAREIRPDIILADVGMPGMTGYELSAAVRGLPELATTPLLLLTGTFESYDERRAREVGATDHISKPFEAQALVDKVFELLEAAERGAPVAGPSRAEGPLLDAASLAESDFGSRPSARDGAGANAMDPLDFSGHEDDEATLDRIDVTGVTLSELPNSSFEGGLESLLEDDSLPSIEDIDLVDPVAEQPHASASEEDFLGWTQTLGTPAAGESPAFSETVDSGPARARPVGTPAGAGVPAGPGPSDPFDPGAGPAPDPFLDAADFDLPSHPPSDASQQGFSEELEPTFGALDVQVAQAPEPLEAPLDAPFGAAGEPAEGETALIDPLADLDLEPSLPEAPRATEIRGLPEARQLTDARDLPPAEFQVPLDPSEPDPQAETSPTYADGSPIQADPPPGAEPIVSPEDSGVLDLGWGLDAPATPPASEPALLDPAAAAAAPAPQAKPASEAPSAAVELSREVIHAALEKATWEALGPLSEQLVQQFTQKLEEVVWEIVPALAERLIREEIERLKATDAD